MTFAHKQFEGVTYTFEHLKSRLLKVALSPPSGTVVAQIDVQFGSHCFTEGFDATIHGDHHRYTHAGELRAFDKARHDCSLYLPGIVDAMGNGKIYRSADSYTYVAQIPVPPVTGFGNYSVFFSLEAEKGSTLEHPRAKMFVKSAYPRDLAAPANAQSWRFSALVGFNTGVYQPVQKPRPTKVAKASRFPA
jgi:hypothetical protein